MIQKEQFENMCQESIHCTYLLCQYYHYRKYQGVCIQYIINLQNFQGNDEDAPRKCESKECKLYHLDESKLNDKIQLGTINGFYCFNFCRDQCDDEKCKFVHKTWIKEYCIDDLIFKCKKKECKQTHKQWRDIKEQIKKQYQIHKFYPENFCENRQSPQFLKDYCMNYVFGECPHLKQKCQKKFHSDWENIYSIFQIIQPCTQRGIYKESLFGNQKQQESLARLICEEKQFQNFKSQIGKSNIIDIVFIMDLTGSMQIWRQQMINNIETIIAQFNKDIKNQIIRVGFVGYRDNCDEQEDQLKYFNLTQNISELLRFIIQLESKGGGDTAEDIISGLKQILNLNLSRNQESMLCIFLIADSPCHGRQYHDLDFNGADDQLDKVIGTPLEDTMKAIKNLKKKNFFFCIKITEHTEKMFKVMQDVMEDMLVITSQTKPEELAGTVLFSLQQSYTKSQIQRKQNNKYCVGASFEKPKIQKYDISSNLIDKQKFWNDFQANLNKNCRSGETCLEIDIEKQQEIQSKKIRIFNAFDAINNQYIVIKISDKYLKLYEQKGQVDQKDISEAEKEAEIRYFSQCYACQIAGIYRKNTKNKLNNKDFPPIFYAIPILYKLKEPFKGLKTIYGESLISNTFEKFTTNEKILKEQNYYYTVFSHFSYTESNGLFVITDLQGSYSIFTDPSIQISKEQEKYQSQSDKSFILLKDVTNLGEKGIQLFKNNHKNCSYLCKSLQLKPINDEMIINDENKYNPPNPQTLQIICDECNQFADITFESYYQQSQETLCDNCIKEQNDQQEVVCKCCKFLFSYPPNIQLKALSLLGICSDCKRLQCLKNSKLTCFYCYTYCKKFQIQIKSIEKQEIHLCQISCNYLESLKCKKCNKQYNYQKIISQENYENPNSFSCC